MNNKNGKEMVPVMQSKGDDKCSFRCNLKLIIFVSCCFPMKIKKKISGLEGLIQNECIFPQLGLERQISCLDL